MSERITDNVNPTHEDVREWGYDEDLFFMEQDEDLLLYGLYYVPVLLELAQDVACPKRQYALSILGQFTREAALHRKSDGLRGLEPSSHASPSDEPSVKEWREYLRRLLAYQQRPFVVEEAKGWAMAQDLLLGIGRVGKVTRIRDTQPDAWLFSLVTSIREDLLINKQTGAYTYQRVR